MIRDRFVLILSFWASILAVMSGCSKQVSEDENKPTDLVVSVINACRSGMVVSTVSYDAAEVSLTFEDGSVLVIPRSEMKIADCRKNAPASVGVPPATNVWCISGLLTGISYTPEKSDAESLVVYAYTDGYTLYLHLSNGSFIYFKSRIDELRRRRSLPVVRITTTGPVTSREDYVHGKIEITDAEGIYGPKETFSATMKIRGRGNSTWDMPKKPYKVKFDSKASILGMPADKEWALLANYADKTLLRNVVAMEISRICGFKWTPRMVSVELYLNGEYDGVYTFCEHKKVSSDRVNINVAGDGDIEGDYYLELEQNMDETVCFWTGMGAPVMFQEPSEPNQAQQDYVKKYFSDFEDALRRGDSSYKDYIDEKSFIDNYIIQELTKNIDGNLRKSTFLTKQKGGKLEMYHVWDFDLTLGNCNYFASDVPGLDNSYTGFFIRYYSLHGKNTGWYYHLFKHKDFEETVRARWKELYPQLREIPQFISEQAFILEEAQKRNFQRWNILNQWVWPNEKVLGTYEAEVDYLTEFYSSRLEWLNGRI